MKNAIILHGKPTKERYENPEIPKPHQANWLPWLGRQLSSRGVDVSIPALPRPYFPVYEDWEAVFPGDVVSPETCLIGHSAGAEFILRWLSENKTKRVGHVALVAPYHDFESKYGDFSRYELDAGITERSERLTILNSHDDDQPIQANVERLTTALSYAQLIELDGFGHFRIGHNMQSEEFPQLLELLQPSEW